MTEATSLPGGRRACLRLERRLVDRTMGSVLGARSLHTTTPSARKASFVASSTGIASTLKLAIQQEKQPRHKCQIVCCCQPECLQCRIPRRWISHDAGRRSAFLKLLDWASPPSFGPEQLPQFIARMNADPPQSPASGQSYQITPSGNRPLLLSRSFRVSQWWPVCAPPDTTYCAGPNATALQSSALGR